MRHLCHLCAWKIPRTKTREKSKDQTPLYIIIPGIQKLAAATDRRLRSIIADLIPSQIQMGQCAVHRQRCGQRLIGAASATTGHNRPQPSNSLKPRLGIYIFHVRSQAEVGAGAVHPQGLGHGLHYALCHDFPTQVEWISDVPEIGKAPCKPAPWEPHPPGRGLNL